MRRSHVVVAAIATVAVLAGAGAVWLIRGGEGPEGAAARYADAWSRGDFAAMRGLTDGPPADFETRLTRTRDDLGVTRQRYAAASVGRPKDGKAGGSYSAELTLSAGRTWKYTGALPLVQRDGDWRVAWSPDLVHPMLQEGQRLRAARAWPDRAEIQAADGSSLNASPSGSVQQFVGPVGALSAEAAAKIGPPYQKGDPGGLEGLQRQYERRLAGTPALSVQIVGADGTPVKTLQRFGGSDGKPLRTTLDPKVQRAAGEALGAVDKPASLVALRPSTGEVLAVANKPGGYNRALMGQYPPGSTFKVVTAAALVAGGMDAGTKVPCPATTTVGGRTFKNYKHEDFGTIPLREAFAHSCNTTFARLAVDKLGEKRLAQVAAQFGFNAPVIAGLPAVRAAFPQNKDDTSFASASFGQGQVLTSPLNMAGVAAAAASGTWRSPRVVDQALAAKAVDAKGRAPEKPHRLEPAIERALHSLMPAVVSEGTAAGVGFPSGTAGKTGTAEFGEAAEGADPPTHAWFIGYRGDLAFAVIVEGGGTGAEAAAPLAARFLKGVR
ncbi:MULTISPECIES: penicillin-binding transpeptidase domain-containing protein [Thermomonosporaceae]|uniref:penicillin-binding transpeptidase domain-containing protein n=1 Tax=Thermomonosporaceae TaxID=2012 RepID=UPI00255ACF05|nr:MULTISPECIES: penicillin-binding transpeptidase domain-containing protein [Thermomonosporaceae]MDL4775047.1 penicillin-binding transpeptidase domain-containing protein [Actinomadura xylanilytica]